MADDEERLQAFAQYVKQFPTSQAGDFTGKLVQVRFAGGTPPLQYQCILLDWDTAGIHVKRITGGSPSETQFYLWHVIGYIGQ